MLAIVEFFSKHVCPVMAKEAIARCTTMSHAGNPGELKGFNRPSRNSSRRYIVTINWLGDA